jgi:hypothetical protein
MVIIYSHTYYILEPAKVIRSYQNLYIEEQTTQWPKEKGQKDKRPPSSNAAVSAESERKWTCSLCKRTDNIDIIKVPYVFKYLVAELAAINIKVNLKRTNNDVQSIHIR